MENFLRLREIGASSPTTLRNAQNLRLYHSLVRDERCLFRQLKSGSVNGLDIDKVEHRYLLSANGDSSITLYDCDTPLPTDQSEKLVLAPVASVPARSAHTYGVSEVKWHPTDNGLFTTSSYDETCRVFDTETFQEACTFELGSKVYAHDASPCPGADHSLIAACCELPAVRLCDLRTGTAAHMLAGHRGAVCTAAWSPTRPYVLATGGTDGTLRLWDIRRADGATALLDRDNIYTSPPNASTNGSGSEAYGMRHAASSGRLPQAHTDVCNGVAWTSDGLHLVSTGHDNKLRLWDLVTGWNMLVHYGTSPLNTHWQQVRPLIVDGHSGVMEHEEALLIYPSDEGQILRYGLWSGFLHGKQFVLNGRVTCLTHRGPGRPELYSGDAAGQVIKWSAFADAMLESEEDDVAAGGLAAGDALSRVHREMTSRPVTFS